MDSVKSAYFALEDKYYEVLDAVQKKIPVYSVVDPVDKIVPSFGIVLVLGLLIILGGATALLGGLSFAPENVSLSLTFNDSAGAPVEGVNVLVDFQGETLPSDLAFPLSKQTTSTGKVVFSLPPGTYVVRVEDELFEPFSQEVIVSEGSSKIFSLQPKQVLAATRTLLIQDDSQKILGIPTPLSISLSFSCQTGTPPLPQTVFSGNVSIEQPPGCTGLSVTVTANGFVTKTQLILGDTTVIPMQSSASLGPDDDPAPVATSGTVEVYSKSAANAGLSGVQVKLYKVPPAGSNILTDQTLSDSSGFSLFEEIPPGKYVVIAAKQGYKQTTSSEFSVVAGETNTINLSLPESSSKHKLFVKILSASAQTPLPGAEVNLFVQTVGGKYIEYNSYTADANGVVDQELADFNGTTQLVVKKLGFILQIVPNAGIVLSDDTTPFPILMEPAQAASSNGSIPNGVVADVKVVDEIGFPVLNADTYLYTPDVNGILVDTKKSAANGVAHYINLPPGSYQAAASTKDFDGTSVKVDGDKGKIITLQVPLQVGSALVEVTVKTEQNQIVSDANVSIIKLSGNVLQAKASTNATGVAQLGVLSGQTVYVRVEKPGYLPFSSVPFDIIKDNTHKITLEVSLTSATPSVDMSLTSIYQIATSGSQSLAQSIASGNTYAFHFSVKTPDSQTGLKSAVRLNGTTPSLLSADVGQVIGAQSSLGGLNFYTTFNSKDEFAPSNQVNSGTPAKIVINTLGDVNGGAYELIVFVKVNPLAVPNTDKLKINYQAKSGTQSSALYEATYTIGQNIPPQGDFLYLFFLTQEGSTNKVQISSAKPAVLEQNKNYTLEYLLTNVSGTDFSAATASFPANGSIVIVPGVASLPGFANNKSVGGTLTLKSTQTCSSSQSYCASTIVQLNNVGTGKQPTTYTLQFFTAPEKAVSLNVSPSFLIPNQANQVVQAVGLDNFGVPLTAAANGMQVDGQLKNSAGVDIGTPIHFTATPNGVFIAAIPAALDGSDLVITGTASGYISATQTIPVTTSSVASLSQDFSCVSVTTNSNPFALVQNAKGTITVKTTNCGESVKIFTDGFGSILVPVATSGNAPVMNEQQAVLLPKDGSVNLMASAPSLIGVYPINIHAKFESQASYSTIQTLDLLVSSAAPASQCLDLKNSKYTFDITDGSDSAVFENKCNPFVYDSFMPAATLDVENVYAHTLPSLLTPEMKSPGSSIPFDWQIFVDYNNTSSTDVNLSDFTKSPALLDANWNRYEISDGSNFLNHKTDFAAVVPIVISDSVNVKIGDSTNLYLEGNNKNVFPFYAKGPHSWLYETTLIATQQVKIDEFCVADGGLENTDVYLDGVIWAKNGQTMCGSNSVMKNKILLPGPHTIQIFTRQKDNADYWLVVKFKSAQLNITNYAALSKPKAGLYLNPEYGIPLSSLGNEIDHVNGSYTLFGTPAHDTISPELNHLVPKKLDTPISQEIAAILTNESGIEHLKNAYVRFYSSNPQVRLFLRDKDVYAQFMGYDDPQVNDSKQPYVIVENTGSIGTSYARMHLADYVTPSQGNLSADVAVLVDASSSVLGKMNALGGSQNGLCLVLQNLENGLEHYSGAAVNFKVFWMGKPIEYTKATLPCASSGLSMDVLNVPTPADFNPQKDSNEFWAQGASFLATNNFWSANSSKLMVVVTDNKPYGLGPQAKLNEWSGSREEDLVQKAVAALAGNGIRGAALYVTPIESTSTGGFGNSGKNDAIEALESFSSQTIPAQNGQQSQPIVEALEFPQFMSVANGQNPFMWESSQNNRIAARLAQTLYPVGEQDIVVKLISNPQNACIGENSEVGFTGDSALPRVQFNWDWDKVSLNMCDQQASAPGSYLYCDGFQFAINLTKKLEALRNAYDSTPSDPDYNQKVAQIPQLSQFNAYLIRDNFNDSMRQDFVAYETTSSFADAPDYFKSSFSGAWKDYFSSANRLIFKVNGTTQTTLPSSGLYRVSINFVSETDPQTFFVGGSPSATIQVSLDLLSQASSLPGYSDFYEIPFDGFLGYDEDAQVYDRNAYGTTFTGNNGVTLVETQNAGPILTFPNKTGVTSLNTYAVSENPDFLTLNTKNRGVLLEIDRIAQTFVVRPSVPTPVLGEWSTDSSGKGDLFYGVQSTATGQFLSYNTSLSPLTKWKPISSLNKQPTLGCTSETCDICLDGGGKPFTSSLAFDSNPVSGTCSNTFVNNDSSKAFGFHSTSGQSNQSYLATVIYSDVQQGQVQDYALWLTCNANTTFPTGKMAIGDQVVDKGGESTALAINGNSTLQTTFDGARVVSHMVDLIGTETPFSSDQGWSCISNTGGKTRVYWNVDQLYEQAAQSGTSFASFTGNVCTSTGTPLSPFGIWTLNSLSDQPISGSKLTKAQADAFCPLWNTYPAGNAYGSYGIPYPVGTQRFLVPGGGTPVFVNDPINPNVQYRSDPQNCPISGNDSVVASCLKPTPPLTYACKQNDYLLWSTI